MTDDGYEWRVTYFPSDINERHVRGTEEKMRARFAGEVEAGTAPILERRPIPPKPEWEIVENSG